MVTRFRKDGILYSFYIWESDFHDGYKNFITLVCTGDDFENIYNVPVNDVSGYRIKINKKSCSAAGGARGLFCFLSDCIKSDFMMDWVYKFIRQYDVKGECTV